ncbi:MAG: stage II sporulation protein P [Ruminococcus sp.]|nr:stage II sporulation protein P [Ruminococcus sp.]
MLKNTVILSLSVIALSVGLPFGINALSENQGFKEFADKLKYKKPQLQMTDFSDTQSDTPFFSHGFSAEFHWVKENPPDKNPPSTDNKPIELPLPDKEILSKIPYPDDIDDNDGTIQAMQYGFYTAPSYITLKNGGQVRNCTNISNDTLLELSNQKPDLKIELDSSEPQVLIYHSHATESYEPYSRDFYDADFSSKTTDITKNMIAVGEEIVSQLEEAGICTLHDKSIHDYPSYNDAYNSSRKSVIEILEQYPSIKVVLDIHRDGIEREDGTRIAPVVEVDGEKAAQVMIISCCDDGSGNIPLYKENFKLASLFQSQLETDYAGITRPVLFDSRFYNQDLSVGSLLIEIGSHGNSLSEAKLSGRLVGKSISDALKNLSEPVD